MFQYLFEKANSLYEKIFFNYGKFLANNYYKVICASLLVNLVLSLGILRIQMLTDAETLFFPVNSRAKHDEKHLKSIYTNTSRLSNDFYLHQISDFGTWAEINFQTCDNTNILSEKHMKEIQKIHETILNISNFESVCARRNDECLIDGADLLSPNFYEKFLKFSMQKKDDSEDKYNKEYDKKNFRFYISQSETGVLGFTDLTYNLGKHFRINLINESMNGSEPAFSRLIKLRYNLKDNFENAGFDVQNWELEFIKFVQQITKQDVKCNSKDGNFKISYAASKSLDIEMAANIGVDSTLIVGTFCLIIIFACFIMSIGSNWVTSPGYVLPFSGIASAFLGISSSFGLCSYFNYPGCNLIYVIPFLVIGIGIDDMFIIYSSYLHSSKSRPDKSHEEIVQEFISKTLARSGVSITITSLTDFTAFMIGITTGFRSVQIFCIYAGVSIFFCYFNQITLFSGCLCVHSKRVLESRNSCLPCIKSKSEPIEIKLIDLKKIKKFFSNTFKFLICSSWGKLITLGIFLSYITFSAYNAYQIHEGIKLEDLVSEDSYYSDYIKDNAELNDLYPIIMIVIDKPINYDSHNNRLEIQNLMNDAMKIDGVSSNFRLNWLDSFKSKKIGYKKSLDGLLDTLGSYPPFLNDVIIKKVRFDHELNESVKEPFVLGEVNTRDDYEYVIESSRFYLQYSKLFLSSLDAKPMHMLRKLCDESKLPVFVYSITFKFYEQFEETLPNVIQSFIIAVECMYLISLIFIPDLVSVFCIITSMLSIMTGLLGFMHLWGLSLSSITMIELIMSVGFCVDFSAHVTHAFITNGKGSRNRRAFRAFKDVGVPITNSAISTIIGISLLAFCVVNSLLFLPVLLSVVGPNWPRHKEVKSLEKGDPTELVQMNVNVHNEQ